MRDLLVRPVFRVGEDAYTLTDVTLAAALWGDWEVLRKETRVGLTCLKHFRETGRPLPESDVEDAAIEFRYDHDMVSAQEAEEWLRKWDLTASQWMEYVRRTVLRAKYAARIAEFTPREPLGHDEIEEATWVSAICSGLLSRMVPRVAARAAVRDRLRNAKTNGRGTFAPDAIAEVERSIPLPGLEFDSAGLAEAKRRIAEVELAVREFRADLLTPRAIAEQVSSHHLDWIRVEYQAIAFPAEAMAREALLCVRDDGMDFEELAADAGVADLRAETQWIGEVKGPLHGALLGARPGEVVGPLSNGNRHEVYRLTAKRLPSASDPDVIARAERSIMQRTLAAEMQERVQWLINL